MQCCHSRGKHSPLANALLSYGVCAKSTNHIVGRGACRRTVIGGLGQTVGGAAKLPLLQRGPYDMAGGLNDTAHRPSLLRSVKANGGETKKEEWPPLSPEATRYYLYIGLSSAIYQVYTAPTIVNCALVTPSFHPFLFLVNKLTVLWTHSFLHRFLLMSGWRICVCHRNQSPFLAFFFKVICFFPLPVA